MWTRETLLPKTDSYHYTAVLSNPESPHGTIFELEQISPRKALLAQTETDATTSTALIEHHTSQELTKSVVARPAP